MPCSRQDAIPRRQRRTRPAPATQRLRRHSTSSAWTAPKEVVPPPTSCLPIRLRSAGSYWLRTHGRVITLGLGHDPVARVRLMFRVRPARASWAGNASTTVQRRGAARLWRPSWPSLWHRTFRCQAVLGWVTALNVLLSSARRSSGAGCSTSRLPGRLRLELAPRSSAWARCPCPDRATASCRHG